MKKILLVLLLLILALGLGFGATVWALYQTTTEEDIPAVQAFALGRPLAAVSREWHVPVLDGLLYKDFTQTATAAASGAAETAYTAPVSLGLQAPAGYDVHLTVAREADVVYAGSPAGWDDAHLLTPGRYTLDVVCRRPQQRGAAYGSFTFSLSFSVQAPPPAPAKEPALLTGKDVLRQGDIFTMQAMYLPPGVVPAAQTELGFAVFTPAGEENCWFAAVPVGNQRAPGVYTFTVVAGDLSWPVSVTVESFPFIEQDLIIDETAPEITEANSAEAYAQYNAKVPPLWQTYDEQRYWVGPFLWPVTGRVTTEFGLTRYTNGDRSRARIHPAIDIAAVEGTPIQAPNNGRVVFAEYLLNTGWTVAIEHGGGLKSFYYHCFELNVAVGDMVQKGQQIGLVGSTGYSTGAHLHFEVRIGNQPVSPTMLFEETSGLYSLPGPEDEDAPPA